MPNGFQLVGDERGAALVCRALALPHGFATRRGGLDFSAVRGEAERLAAYERFAALVGLAGARLFRARQVHGDGVIAVEAGDRPEELSARAADALVTGTPGTAVGVLTADCAPVLIADPARRVVAAAHAGWRGAAVGVLQATVGVMVERFGCNSRRMIAAVGPCIGATVYQVGEEVAASFEQLEGAVRRELGQRPHLDLARALSEILASLGLTVALAARCTHSSKGLFFSFRRDGATGRQLSAIGLPAE